MQSQVKTFRRTLCVIALLVFSSTSCTSNDSAAVVNGVKISRTELELTLKELTETGQITVVDGEVSGDDVRLILTALIQGEVTNQLLKANNEKLTSDDLEKTKQKLEQNASELPAHLKDLIVELNAGTLALSRVLPPSSKQATEMYNNAPASLGVMCIRHLVVKELATANEALKKYATLQDFATLAGQYSFEENAKQSGGALSGQDNSCMLLSEYQSGFDHDFTVGALIAKPGRIAGPVKSSFGYHLIYVRPFDEVATDIGELIGRDAGNLLLSGMLATSKIKIASAYGRWDSASGNIVAN